MEEYASAASVARAVKSQADRWAMARAKKAEWSFHRIISGAPITPRELRLAGYFAFVWFVMDAFWFVATINHWLGL